MSKAFTRESDEVSGDEIQSQLLRLSLSAGARNYITREGADRLRERLNRLLEEQRVLAGTNDATTPNANSTLGRLESEIQKLQVTLSAAIVADPPADREKVAFGAAVLVRDQHGEESTYQIVGAGEVDPGEGRISSASPLARALLTRRAGEKVSFHSPGGQQELTILSVRY